MPPLPAAPGSFDGGLLIVLVCRSHPEPTQTFHRRSAVALRKVGIAIVRVALHAAKGAEEPNAVDGTVLLGRSGARGGRTLLMHPLAALWSLVPLLWHARRGNKEGGRPGALAAWWDGLRLAEWARRRGDVARFHAQFAAWDASAAWVAARILGIPFSFEIHNPYTFVVGRSLLAAKARAADRIAAISEEAKARLVALEPSVEARIAIVRCGVDRREIEAAARENVAAYDVLAVGSLVPRKGHDVLIRAMARVGLSFPDAECVILGEGPERKALEKLIHETSAPVNLLGASSEAATLRMSSKATIACLACVVAPDGDEDGIPVALMEAMAAGTPVVSTPVGGIAELLEGGRAGILVPEGDPTALASAIERLLSDAALRARLSIAGRAAIAQRHVLTSCAQDLSELLSG